MLEMYLHMNTLLYGNSLNAFLGKNASASILKSSGTRTPLPASKVLRWKDLEAAALEVANPGEELEIVSEHSEVKSEGGMDVLHGEDFSDGELQDVEELFV
jgi:hypothetical protein